MTALSLSIAILIGVACALLLAGMAVLIERWTR